MILVHHTAHDKGQSSIDGKVRGSNEFSIRAHTEIILIGKEEILRSNENIYPKDVLESAQKQGATIGIYFKVCKKANILEQTILWAHLPQNASEWIVLAHVDLDGNEIEDGLCAKPHEEHEDYVQEIALENEPEILLDCGNEAKTLIHEENKIVALCKEKGAIKSSDVEASLSCKSSKAQAFLKELCEKNIIRREGKGRATKYLLV